MTPNRRVTWQATCNDENSWPRCSAAWPLAARAQQPKVPTIGALVIGNISPEAFWREFRRGLHDLGYIEGQNIRFEFRSAEGQIGRLPELAAELVRLKVDVIVTWFTPTAVAAKQATREIPIVMAETGDVPRLINSAFLSDRGGRISSHYRFSFPPQKSLSLESSAADR